jgi:hypothetical protein
MIIMQIIDWWKNLTEGLGCQLGIGETGKTVLLRDKTKGELFSTRLKPRLKH